MVHLVWPTLSIFTYDCEKGHIVAAQETTFLYKAAAVLFAKCNLHSVIIPNEKYPDKACFFSNYCVFLMTVPTSTPNKRMCSSVTG